jgi:hypothetical protein
MSKPNRTRLLFMALMVLVLVGILALGSLAQSSDAVGVVGHIIKSSAAPEAKAPPSTVDEPLAGNDCGFIRNDDLKNYCRNDCSFIRNADMKNYCRKDCSFIRNADLKNHCRGDCSFIRNADMKNYCRKDCSFIRNSDLKNYCRGDCSFIRNDDMKNLCRSSRPYPF